MYPQGTPGAMAGMPAAQGAAQMGMMAPGAMGGMGGMGGMMMMPGMDMSAFGGMDLSSLAMMGAMPLMGAGAMGGMAHGMGGMGGMPGAAMMGMGGMGGMPPAGDNSFFKTRMCHKWQEGKCNYGPGCRYAHGEADLRPSVQGAQPGAGAAAGGMPAGMGIGMGSGPSKAGAIGKNPEIHKTRLCERFMQTGMCPYGTKCTFAHGEQDLRQPGELMAVVQTRGPAAAMRSSAAAPVGAGGIGPALPPGGMGAVSVGIKRQRVDGEAAAVAPEQEILPLNGVGFDMSALQQRFEALKQEINSFAADTGASVAVFAIGGILSDAPDTQPDDVASDAIQRPLTAAAADPRMRLAVVKYGSGGVARQLVGRPEIVKFVCARGAKALSELADRGAAGA